MLQEEVVVVTGGAGLLGRKFCNAIAMQGGVAIVADLDFSQASQVAQEIEKAGGKALSACLDICDKTSIDKLIRDLNCQYGRIDAVVNNAYPRGKNYGRKLEDIEFQDFCESLTMHVGGYFLISQRFAEYFRKNGGGTIVNMGSIYGTIAPRFDIYDGTEMTMPLEYANIKAAIIHMTRYFAQYYKKDGVRCNSLSPGGIFDNQANTFVYNYNQHSGVKGMLDATDVLGGLMFLLSRESKFMTGQNLIIDDGFSL